jgi:hypothetical protein
MPHEKKPRAEAQGEDASLGGQVLEIKSWRSSLGDSAFRREFA